jgi:hypothetical protein
MVAEAQCHARIGPFVPFWPFERKKANIRALLAASNRRDSSGSLMFNSDLL